MTSHPLSVAEALEARRSSPRGIAFLGEAGETLRLAYGDLFRVSLEAAGALRQLGVGPGDRVGILGSTSPPLVAAIFGCWASGSVAVPLAVPLRVSSPQQVLEEVRSRTGRARVALLAADRAIAGLVPGLERAAPRLVMLDELTGPPLRRVYDVDPDDPALVQFTSGSTARPKGVVLSHRTLLSNGLAAAEHVGLSSADVAVSWLPLYHDFGLIGLTLWPLVLDLAAHLIPPELFVVSPRRWLEAMSRYRATITAAPNFAYGLAARSLARGTDGLDLSALRIAANGAEPVDHETMEGFALRAAPTGLRREALLAVYGLAEATLGVSAPPTLAPPPPWSVDAERLAAEGIAEEVDPASERARALVSVGHPIPGVEVAIVGEGGERLGPGRVGEVLVRTEHAMLGYWDDPEATAATVVDGWIRTGDLGVLGPHGLYITGRLKDMIIVGGRNLYPEDAERAAARIPGVRKGNAVAFGTMRRRAGRIREGLVVIAETRLAGEEAARLARQVRAEVARVMRIAADHVVLLVPGSLPKTPSGKLQRALTRKLYEAGTLLSHAVATAGRALGGGRPEPAL